MSKQLKAVPKFANEAEERAFWENMTPQTISTGRKRSGSCCPT